MPNKSGCENLFMSWSLSASHIALSSISTGPSFMVLVQPSVIAADLRLENDLAVQDLKYETLRPALLAAGQVLDVE